MSDTLANERTLEATSRDGQSQRASAEQSQGDTGGQTSDNGKSAQDENIRKLQSTYDKKLADQDRTYKAQMQQQQQQAYQQIQAMQQRLAQMEEAQAPDDYARLELRLKRAEEQAYQYANAYQQAIQAQQAEQERLGALREIADEFGVSVKDLEEATDYKSAVKLALKAQQDKDKRKQEQDDDRLNRNRPDVGGGAPTTSLSKWEQEYDAAMQRKDTPAIMRLLRTQPQGGRN